MGHFAKMTKNLERRISELEGRKTGDPDHDLAIVKEISEIEHQINDIGDYYCKTLGKHLGSSFVIPEKFDLHISVLVPKNGYSVDQITITPLTRISDIVAMIKQNFEGKDPVVKWNEAATVFLVIPFDQSPLIPQFTEKLKGLGTVEALTEVDRMRPQDLIKIPCNAKGALSNFDVITRSTLLLVGDLQFKSELPAFCITHNFKPTVHTYYSCSTCGLNCTLFCSVRF
eukprot:TRINITY_DN7335_c0_g1_i1.p1 TRINITY_DN7335_c0_g1~~TRINITY_DN7335_c0_g1_i1.p1  ORF type:complete len:228 (-),score=37.85 TRINITY_DN7335_c0_g1_i1:349-1032(-)